MAEDTQTLTAYHEAGHAIMAVTNGGRIVHVSIDPPDDDGLNRFGESIVQWPAAAAKDIEIAELKVCLLYTSPSPRDRTRSRMPSSA